MGAGTVEDTIGGDAKTRLGARVEGGEALEGTPFAQLGRAEDGLASGLGMIWFVWAFVCNLGWGVKMERTVSPVQITIKAARKASPIKRQ
jgi:hypothetical protein